MSRNKRTEEAMDRARAAAAQLKPVAGQIRPMAENTKAAAGRQLRKTRAWAAPRVERTGRVLQDRVAPKAARMLSTAAERIEPAKPAGRRWRVALAAALTAAASGAAAIFGRRRLAASGSAGQAEGADDGQADAAAASQNGQATGATGTMNEQARTS